MLPDSQERTKAILEEIAVQKEATVQEMQKKQKLQKDIQNFKQKMLKRLLKKPTPKKEQEGSESEVGRQEQHPDTEMEDLENKKQDSGVHEEKEHDEDKNGNQRQQMQNQIQISIDKNELLNLNSDEESMSGKAAGSEAE